MGKEKKYYAVARGQIPGIYTTWFGPDGAEVQVRGFSSPLYRGFKSLEEAEQWLNQADRPVQPVSPPHKDLTSSSSTDEVIIYTDGGCSANPGPGGYGAVLLSKGKRKEISGGFRRTTNNRMELMACIVALRSLKNKSTVSLHSDSQYVVNSINQGWARRWRANNWQRTKTESAENVDLWQELLKLCEYHEVRFVWVKGHAGNPENERCDRLATAACSRPDLPPDTAYETDRTTFTPLFK